ncbi:hypothetical protein B4070_1344 [Bacillus subtilis]|nr:hypothetical protein B4070_1344 [Bacillus subtilis]
MNILTNYIKKREKMQYNWEKSQSFSDKKRILFQGFMSVYQPVL